MRHGVICLSLVAGLCALAGGGCSKRPSEQMGGGRFEGPRYYHDYLGLTITFPSDWSIQDPQTTRQMARTGEQMIAGDNENMQAALQAGESRTVNLFAVFKHPRGSPVLCNSNICGVAENISHAPGIRTGGDYLFHVRRLLEAGQMKFSFPREVYAETVAGVEFHVMTTELDVPPMKVKQEYFATVRAEYVLLLILSFSSDEERAELRNILDTLTFTAPSQQ